MEAIASRTIFEARLTYHHQFFMANINFSRREQALYAALIKRQHSQMLSDPSLKKIKENIGRILSYTAMPFTDIKEIPEVKVCVDMYEFVKNELYPVLSVQPLKIIPSLPAKLTLTQINLRLDLFQHMYMPYRLEHLNEWDCMISYGIEQWRRTGNFFHFEEPGFQCFDGWLFVNGYYDLVELIILF